MPYGAWVVPDPTQQPTTGHIGVSMTKTLNYDRISTSDNLLRQQGVPRGRTAPSRCPPEGSPSRLSRQGAVPTEQPTTDPTQQPSQQPTNMSSAVCV